MDVSPDGKHIAMWVPQDAEAGIRSLHVTFLLNFFDELRRRVPVTRR
jgi:hypothetical protein